MVFSEPRKVLFHLLIIGALLVAGILYYPAKDGPFVLDDSSSIAANLDIRVNGYTSVTFSDAAYSMNHILHSDSVIPIRPISYLSFALNFYFADEIISAFKLTNIVLHLISGFLVFVLARKILELSNLKLDNTTLDYLSLLTAFVWLVHPLYVSTVLYITQRMTILSALFSLMGVIAFIQYRMDFLSRNTGIWRAMLTIGVCTACAYFSKETGALVPFYCLAIEVIFFRFKFHSATPPVIKAFYGMCLLLPVLVILGYLGNTYLNQLYHPAVTRHFNINERLMTESRVLWQYIGYLLLIDPGGISFHHDNIAVSKSLLSPLSTLISVISWLLIVIAAVLCLLKDKARIFSFAVLWYLCGHLLESSVISLELAFEHRNYAPGIGVLLLAVTCLFFLSRRLLNSNRRALATVALLTLGVPFLLNDLVSAWKNNRTLTLESYQRAPDSPRVLYEMMNISLQENDPNQAAGFLEKLRQLQPWEVGYDYFEIAQHCKENQTIPKALVEQTISRLNNGTPTVFSFNSFNGLIKECSPASNEEGLSPVYAATGASPFKRLAANGLLMLARTERSRSNESEYLRLMNKAKETAMTYEVTQELEKL